MSKKHLKLEPHNMAHSVNGYSVWWYETSNGIDIQWNNGTLHGSGSTQIPWKELRAALKRKDKK